MKPVILGAGLAGLTVALALSPLPVIVVSPRKLGTGCSSAWAQGGIAAAMGKKDTTWEHIEDTIAAGAGLNDANIVRQVIEDAPTVINRLIAHGVGFDRDAKGELDLGLEAAHRSRRIVHAKDATGAAVMRALVAAVRATSSIEVIEEAVATDLISDGRIQGVVLKKRDGEQVVLRTNRLVMASGGAAGLWRDTTNPHENWGGGLALAARAGATLGDLEFAQFHPTALATGRDPMPLLSEALRGEGGTLIDETGKRFTDELQPRDIVARAIWKRMAEGHKVFLDARPIVDFDHHFPNIGAKCRADGIDPLTMPIPARPAAHYHMGGIVTDAKGRTTIDGLWACGEAACTGLNGANRLASNSLLEAASFGWSVAEDIKGSVTSAKIIAAPHIPQRLSPQDASVILEIRGIMSEQVGVIRDQAGLEDAVEFLAPLAPHYDQAFVGLMIAQSALKRKESRGAHFRSDYPELAYIAENSRYVYKENADAVRVPA